MKRVAILLLAGLFVCSCSSLRKHGTPEEWKEKDRIERQQALDEAVGAERSLVVVRRARIEVPKYHKFNDDFILNNFWDSSTHSNFTAVTTDRWPLKWRFFGSSLVDKAKQSGLDSQSLAECLSVISPKVDHMQAYVPYAAVFVEDPKTGRNYWAVTAVWEDDRIKPTPMGHFHIWLLDSQTQQVVEEGGCD